MRAVVTGGEGGIGRALAARLAAEGYEVVSLDLATGFDVTRPEHWERVGPVDLAFLNAGVVTGTADVAALPVEALRRVLEVNVLGVALGVRRLARVLEPGAAIVATASLAGLVGMESDPVYALSKHAVVGLIRSAAPQLAARGIVLAAICPGFADTAMVDGLRAELEAAGLPLLAPEEVADAALRAARGEPGACWFVQPGRPPEPFRFRGVPGPRPRGDEAPS